MRPLIVPATFIVALLAALSLGGCPGGSGDPNDPNSGGSGGIDDRDEFTDARQALVRAIVAHVTNVAGALATLHPLADPRLAVGSQTFGEFGTCPEVTWVTSINGAGTITIEYGTDGCNAAATGAATVGGRIDLTSLVTAGSWRVQPRNVMIDGREWDGSLTLTEQSATIDPNDATSSDGTRTWAADSNFEIVDLVDLRGVLTFGQEADGRFTLSGEQVRLDDAATRDTWFVDFSDVAVDPLAEDNFVPLGGMLSFRDDDFVIIRVEFTERSAERGTVRVTVGNGSTLNFEAVTP